jgi:hypothetical protein
MWNGFFAVLTAVGWVLPFLVSLYAVRIAHRISALPEQERRFYALQLESLKSSHAEMQATLDQACDQIKMMNVRAKIGHGTRSKKATDEPDPTTHPDEWRHWMTRKLNRQKAGLME